MTGPHRRPARRGAPAASGCDGEGPTAKHAPVSSRGAAADAQSAASRVIVAAAADQLPIFDNETPTRAPAPIGAAARRLALPQALAPYRSLLRLGTSTWSFPGWQGLVYDDPGAPYAESRLSREGLTAYAAHPLLGAVGIDRGFYAPIPRDEHARYAAQVPREFRFLVKAPARVTDALRRDDLGRAREPNPDFLDVGLARTTFVEPALDGLGEKLGTLLIQLSPLPAPVLRDVPAFVARLGGFLSSLPHPLPDGARYALELRDAALLTPRLIAMLRESDVESCVALHDRMPPIERQLRALDHLRPDDGVGALTVRWTLHAGIAYEAARRRYAPFRELVDPDPATRRALAERAARALRAGRTVTVIANNKAEGSAPRTLEALADAIAEALDARRA